jgi:hypothetical protein
MKNELIQYKGWENCIRLTNTVVDLVIPTEIGLRIVHFGFLDDENEFYENPLQVGTKEGDEWRIYGGHRLWHAPENMPRTYIPDNEPIHFEFRDNLLRLSQPVEYATGIKKEIDIYMHEHFAQVDVIHRLSNSGLWEVELSPWALTAMAPGGTAIIPLPPRQSHEENLLPNGSIALWAYTDISDPRWNFGANSILLKQDSNCSIPQKIGVMVGEDWVAYLRNGHLFIKKFDFRPGEKYPDMGSSIEVFTNHQMTEIETLGPLTRLAPGENVEHKENWHLLSESLQPDTPANISRILKRIEHQFPQ